MGMFLLVAVVLGGLGLVTLFVSPWIGAPVLAAAVVLGVVGLAAGTTRVATEDPSETEPRDVETPHMPGPPTSD